MSDQTEDPLVTLVRYDVQQVPDATLCRIFRCTPADLAGQRNLPEYAELRAAYTQSDVAGRVNRNAMWDAVEDNALSGLMEVLPATSDPRTLLAAARLANQAKRVAPAIEVERADAAAQGPQVTIVKLRSSFTEALQTPEGAMRLVHRENVASLEASVGADVIPTATAIEKLLSGALGVDPRAASGRTSFGPGIDVFGPGE
jgi:hypothetical protein